MEESHSRAMAEKEAEIGKQRERLARKEEELKVRTDVSPGLLCQSIRVYCIDSLHMHPL